MNKKEEEEEEEAAKREEELQLIHEVKKTDERNSKTRKICTSVCKPLSTATLEF